MIIALDTEVTQLLAALKQETRGRQIHPPLYAFSAIFPTSEALGHLAASEAVFAALAQLCHDSLEAERITQAGAVRIGLSLLADLFAMRRHQYAHTADEVETQIDRLRGPLQAQITAWAGAGMPCPVLCPYEGQLSKEPPPDSRCETAEGMTARQASGPHTAQWPGSDETCTMPGKEDTP